MNKYLADRLADETHLCPRIEKLVFVAAESVREFPSSAFGDFMDEGTKAIRKCLDWKETAEVRQMLDECIEEKDLAVVMTKYGKDGFIAEIEFEIPEDIDFDKDGEPDSWTSCGACYLFWIYADSIGELVEKIIEKDEKEFQEAVDRAKKSILADANGDKEEGNAE